MQSHSLIEPFPGDAWCMCMQQCSGASGSLPEYSKLSTHLQLRTAHSSSMRSASMHLQFMLSSHQPVFASYDVHLSPSNAGSVLANGTLPHCTFCPTLPDDELCSCISLSIATSTPPAFGSKVSLTTFLNPSRTRPQSSRKKLREKQYATMKP